MAFHSLIYQTNTREHILFMKLKIVKKYASILKVQERKGAKKGMIRNKRQ